MISYQLQTNRVKSYNKQLTLLTSIVKFLFRNCMFEFPKAIKLRKLKMHFYRTKKQHSHTHTHTNFSLSAIKETGANRFITLDGLSDTIPSS